jgi:hypothetical protein
MKDDRTPRGYPLPHPDNLLMDEVTPEAGDVMRLRRSITAIDADVEALELANLLGLPV